MIALEEAGFEPEVIKTYSYGAMPAALQTSGRKLVAEATGSPWVPALEKDDGEWISGASEIIEWAAAQASGQAAGETPGQASG